MKERARETEEANNHNKVEIVFTEFNLFLFLKQVSVDTVGNAGEDIFSVLLDPALHDWVGVGGGWEEEQRLGFTSATATNHGWRVLVHQPDQFPEVFLPNWVPFYLFYPCFVTGC